MTKYAVVSVLHSFIELLDLALHFSDAPCLLDELMDNNFITCDVDLGVREVTDCELVMTKESPSHCSDSGISDTRSMSPTSSDYDSDLFDFAPFDTDSFSVPLATDSRNMGEEYNVAIQEAFSPNINSDEAFSPDVYEDHQREDEFLPTERNDLCSVFSETDQSSNIDNTTTSTRVTRSSMSKQFVPISNEKEEICVLNNMEDLVPPKIQTVKVVKVIKTPAHASVRETEMRVLEAIEDRNKKNAIQAKLNRERKKVYVTGLEEEVLSLKMENAELRSKNKKISAEKAALEEEVDYLKSVLANQSALAGLLKNIGSVKNVNLKTSFTSQKRSLEHDHSYDNAKRLCAAEKTAGICLHVDKDDVSLEFCVQCARMANGTSRKNS